MQISRPRGFAPHVAWAIAAALAILPALATSQSIALPRSADAWESTDSLRFATYLGRDATFIDRGAAVARGPEMRDGTFEFLMAATPQTNFLGVQFHARGPLDAEVIFFRVGDSGTSEAVQYAPAFNSVTSAWQVYRGAGANAVAELPREQWIPVRITVRGRKASLYLNGDSTPTLEVPRLAGTGGARLGIWAGGFGRGAWFADLRFTPDTRPAEAEAAEVPPAGMLVDWELSQAFDASELVPGTLPDAKTLRWQRVRPEPSGIVLVNRYRAAPIARLPLDAVTRRVLADSVMNGRVPGSKVVLARTVIASDRARTVRMHFGFSDGILIHHDGRPLYVAMNPQFFRSQGVMDTRGEAVYLTLRRGRNEIVVAVTEYTGGWAFWARLDP